MIAIMKDNDEQHHHGFCAPLGFCASVRAIMKDIYGLLRYIWFIEIYMVY
jgi:hypothetical protein